MKNIPILLVPFFIWTTHAAAQVRIGVKAGFTAATAQTLFIDDGRSPLMGYGGRSMRSTFHAGIMADIPLSRSLSLQPGLQYAGRGERARMDIDMPVEPGLSNWLTATRTVRYQTIELPVNLVAGIRLGKGRIYGGGGPFLGYGVAADVRDVAKGPPRQVNKKTLRFGSDDNSVNRFLMGINATCGYMFMQRWLAAFNYNHAIVSGEYGSYFGLSAGYFMVR